MAEQSGSKHDPLERTLRWIATRTHARPFDLLLHAIQDPEDESAALLEPLVAPTTSLPGGDPETRALAAWGLLFDVISKIGPTKESRRRNALFAAFRLPRRPEIREPWKSTLQDRFDQLRTLPSVFGDRLPYTTTPVHKAWNRALNEKLVPMLQERLDALTLDGGAWRAYVEIGRTVEAQLDRERATAAAPQDPAAGYRRPSKGAQPVFVDLFVTTVFMKGRAAYRRITERLVTAQTDNVDAYMARALAGWAGDQTGLPVRALWGCRAEPIVGPRVGEPSITRLRFPTVLRRGEKHLFSSETINENPTEDRLWVNVEVDHHGIAQGRLLHGCIPISGLTIRIRFDEACLPEECWWYAEQTERERRERPPDGDPRLLTVVGGAVQHTFAERCHPREHYGISFLWPSP